MSNSYLKKVFFLIINFTLCFTASYSQLSQVVSQGDIYAPPSPDATALMRYANVPVDEHTGVPYVILPIDKLAGRQLSVPITLSYHGSGNKVQDLSSNVGLGFVLNAGGVITRVMRGLPDEFLQGYQYKGKRLYSNNIDSAYLNATMNNKIDGEPDLFYFNFLGHMGKMVIDTAGNAQYLPDQGMRLVHSPINSNPDGNNSWILQDLNGYQYVFGSDTTSQEKTMVNLAGKLPTNAITYISSWYLTSITTPDGAEMINFTYHSGPNMSYEQYRNLTTYNIHNEVTDKRKSIFGSKVIHHDDLSVTNLANVDVSTIIQVQNPKYIYSIQNDLGSIIFSYSGRQDVAGGQALTQIKTYNSLDASIPLKTYTLNQSYFISPNAANPSSPDSKRLQLNCITVQGRSAEIKQLFAFTYNQATLLPPRNSDEFDHWGYYTTLDTRAPFPPVNLTQDVTQNDDDSFERRAPDSVRMKACMLTRIRNVNGGYTSFSYEANTYFYNGAESFGGGLRIKTITESDSLGQVVPIVKRYSYTIDDGVTSSGLIYNSKPYYIQGITNYQAGTVVKPIPSLLSYEAKTFKSWTTDAAIGIEVALFATGVGSIANIAIDVAITVIVPAVVDAFQFAFHRTHHYHYDSPPFAISSTPLSNLFDINGASVTYSQVTVTKGDGGKTVNYYTSQQQYPDSASAVQMNFLAQPVKIIYGNTGSYPPNTSLDFERGLLLNSKAYDNSNHLVSQLTNTYQLSKRVASVYGQRSSISGYAMLANGSFQVITYCVGLYKELAENIQLLSSTTQIFDQTNNGSAVTTTNGYSWQSSYPTLLHSQSTMRSDGKMLVTYYTYPMEYHITYGNDGPSNRTFISDMVTFGFVGYPIEIVNTLQNQSSISITGGKVFTYKLGGGGLLDTIFSLSVTKPIPMVNFKFSNQTMGTINGPYQAYNIDKSYVPKTFYQKYDSKNNLIQSQNVGEPSSSVIWGYDQTTPIAKISNATTDKIAYTSFETNDQQYWSFTPSGRDSSGLAKTGKIRYQLSTGALNTIHSPTAGTYILSFWTQGSKPTIGGTTADVSIVNGESDNNSWKFYMDRITLSGTPSVTISGSGYIDELRLYPLGAHINTLSIIPQVGISSTNSPDDKVTTVEYDALLRNKTVRDDQRNILKKYDYSNVSSVGCMNTPDNWIGINPVCYTDQSGITPDTTQYKIISADNYGKLVCNFSRTTAQSSYTAQVNFTASYSDNTTYSSSIILKNGQPGTAVALPDTGKSAVAVINVGIDSIINLTDDYAVTYQRYQNRQRVRDSYTESNTLSGGLGYFIAPIRSSSGCSLLFSNHAQTSFYKNNCSNLDGSYVEYTVPKNTYSAATQFQADSIARAVGQSYANANGNCTSVDTSFVGRNPYCITGTADNGTPSLSAYSSVLNNNSSTGNISATITRTSAEAAHDAIITYNMNFNDGSTATYTTPFYKAHQILNISPPLAGYTPSAVVSIAINNVVYGALKRRGYSIRQRYLNGVADGYQENNTTGTYYLAPIEDPSACGNWYYNVPQTGYYTSKCSAGGMGIANYTNPARTDSSMVSQTYADALARVRGQAHVNSGAVSCSQSSPTLNYSLANNTNSGYQVNFGNSSQNLTYNFSNSGTNSIQVPPGVYTVTIYPTGAYVTHTITLGSRTPVQAPRTTFYTVNVATSSTDMNILIY